MSRSCDSSAGIEVICPCDICERKFYYSKHYYQNKPNLNINIDEFNIQQFENTKFLGLFIDQNLS